MSIYYITDSAKAPHASNFEGFNFSLNAEQKEVLDLAEQFTANEIIPVAADYDKSGEFPWPVIKKAHEVGLMNLHIDPKYGGQTFYF